MMAANSSSSALRLRIRSSLVSSSSSEESDPTFCPEPSLFPPASAAKPRVARCDRGAKMRPAGSLPRVALIAIAEEHRAWRIVTSSARDAPDLESLLAAVRSI